MGGTWCGPRTTYSQWCGTRTKVAKPRTHFDMLDCGIEAKFGKDWWKPPTPYEFKERNETACGEKIGETNLDITFDDAQFLFKHEEKESPQWSIVNVVMRSPKDVKLREKYDLENIKQAFDLRATNWRWNNNSWTRTIRFKIPLPAHASIGKLIFDDFPKDNTLNVIECWVLTRVEKERKWILQIYSRTKQMDDMRSIRTFVISENSANTSTCNLTYLIEFLRKDPDNSSIMMSMIYPRMKDSAKRIFSCQFEDFVTNVLGKLRIVDGEPLLVV
jgi:hypothetical protein